MGLQTNLPVTSADMISFKNTIKAEMARRRYKDSLASYNTNYTTTPAVGTKTLLTQFNQTVGHINLIKATGISSEKMYALDSALDAINTYASHPKDWTSTDCTNSSCRGLCYSECSEGCRNGCSGGCQSSCDGCNSTCTDVCAPGCGGSCGAACESTCSNHCTSAHGNCSNNTPSTL